MNKHTVETINNCLILKTKFFKTEKRSVLHSGIFSRELSATFLSAGLVIAYVFFVKVIDKLNLVHYLISTLLFIILFPLSRAFIFQEPLLVTTIDKDKETITVSKRGLFRTKTVGKKLSSIDDIKSNHIKFEPDNPDGVAFVEKIARQHNTVIPDFGQTEHFYTVQLVFKDDDITIFSSKNREESQSIISQFKSFINSDHAKT